MVDLPLVPVMATNGAPGAHGARSRQNSSMSPITGTPACCASRTVQCGVGWVSGTPGASTSAAILDQSTVRKSAVGMPAALAFATLCCIVVVADDIGAAGKQRAGADQPRAAQAEHRDLFARKGRDRDHEQSYLNFKVDSPASASTTETIQKRMTICGSVQPSCSK